ERFLRRLGFTAVPENGFFETARTAVVEICFALADPCRETDAPERRCAPLGAGGVTFTHIVGQTSAHVMQQQVRVGMDGLVAEFGHGMIQTGLERRRMALPAARAAEQCLTLQRLRVSQVATGADT